MENAEELREEEDEKKVTNELRRKQLNEFFYSIHTAGLGTVECVMLFEMFASHIIRVHLH